MADRVRLVERIVRRGYRKLEKRQAGVAKRLQTERERAELAAQRDAEYLVKRAARIAEYEAVLAKRAERKKGILGSKRVPSMHPAARSAMRLAKMQARETIQAEKREIAALRRRAKRLPPLPYSKAPPLPY